MPSATHGLFLEAMRLKRQIICTYQGYRREICPSVLGRTGLEERALVFQFGGESSQGKVTVPDWKCFRLSEVEDIVLREGPWHAGGAHSERSPCMKMVEYDVNPQSPYDPAFRL